MILYNQNIPDSSIISYYNLADKPSINGIILDGSISLNDLGVPSLNNFNHQIDLFRVDLNSLRGSKQDKLISGTNIKTINGNNLLGTGNINIASGVTSVNGQTGDVVINVKDIDLTNYVKTEDLVPINRKITTLESDIKTISDSSVNYYTKSQIDAKKYLTEVPSNYVTTTMLNTTTTAINSSINTLDNKIKTIQDSSVNYFTKSQIDANYYTITEANEYLAQKVEGMPNPSLPRIERIAVLTAAEYEGRTPDENTLYLIK